MWCASAEIGGECDLNTMCVTVCSLHVSANRVAELLMPQLATTGTWQHEASCWHSQLMLQKAWLFTNSIGVGER